MNFDLQDGGFKINVNMILAFDRRRVKRYAKGHRGTQALPCDPLCPLWLRVLAPGLPERFRNPVD